MEYHRLVYPRHYISCMTPLSAPTLKVSSRFSQYRLSGISCRLRFRYLFYRFDWGLQQCHYFPLMLEWEDHSSHDSPLPCCIILCLPVLLREGLVVTFYCENENFLFFRGRVIRGLIRTLAVDCPYRFSFLLWIPSFETCLSVWSILIWLFFNYLLLKVLILNDVLQR